MNDTGSSLVRWVHSLKMSRGTLPLAEGGAEALCLFAEGGPEALCLFAEGGPEALCLFQRTQPVLPLPCWALAWSNGTLPKTDSGMELGMSKRPGTCRERGRDRELEIRI